MIREALVVEDNASTADALCRVLRTMDFSVNVATTLEAARARVSQSTPDLVLLDLALPDGDGLDFMHELKESEQTKCVVITGNKSQQAAVESLRADAQDFLVKPVTLSQLRQTINKVSLSFSQDEPNLSSAENPTTNDQDMSSQSAVDALVGKSFWHLEKDLLLATLKSTNGDKAEAARILGISLKTLYNRLHAYS